jgi:hypothetical protein
VLFTPLEVVQEAELLIWWIQWKFQSITREVFCWVQPPAVVHFQVGRRGLPELEVPTCWVRARGRAARATRMSF